MTTKPLVELVMIVKNCLHSITETLTPLKQVINHWTVLDTGSTDGSQDMVRYLLREVEGELYEEPFVDFATSRNRALELAKKNCVWTIMIDDSYQLSNPFNFKVILEQIRNNEDIKGLQVNIRHESGFSYFSPRIFRSEETVRYKYPIHEKIVTHEFNDVIPPDVFFFLDQEYPESVERRQERQSKDIDTLKDELRKDPDDPRMLFYLAQTYKSLNKKEDAIFYYRKREEVGPVNTKMHSVEEKTENKVYDHELFLTLLALGELEDENKSVTSYLKCFQIFPENAEPLYRLALHYWEKEEYEVSFMFAEKAYKMKPPPVTLNPIDYSVYQIKIPKLYYGNISKLELEERLNEARSACRKVLHYDRFESETVDNFRVLKGKELKRVNKDKKRAVFVAGKYYDKSWTAQTLLTTGLGGTETAVVEISNRLTSYFDEVIVFVPDVEEKEKECITNDLDRWDNEGGKIYDEKDEKLKQTLSFDRQVVYKDLAHYDEWMKYNFVDFLVVVRDPTYLRYDNVKKVYLWLHDTSFPTQNIQNVDDERLDGILYLSDFHLRCLQQNLPDIQSSLYVKTRNGIDTTLFSPGEKKRYKFIYSSCPTRGLETIIDMWPEINRRLGGAELHIYGNFNTPYAQKNMDIPLLEKKIRLIKGFKVYKHSFVNQAQLAEAYKTADIWFYPTNFPEVSCITAMQAYASGCLCIYNDEGALPETLNGKGIKLPEIFNVMQLADEIERNVDDKRLRISDNEEYRNKVSWDVIVEEWYNNFV